MWIVSITLIADYGSFLALLDYLIRASRLGAWIFVYYSLWKCRQCYSSSAAKTRNVCSGLIVAGTCSWRWGLLRLSVVGVVTIVEHRDCLHMHVHVADAFRPVLVRGDLPEFDRAAYPFLTLCFCKMLIRGMAMFRHSISLDQSNLDDITGNTVLIHGWPVLCIGNVRWLQYSSHNGTSGLLSTFVSASSTYALCPVFGRSDLPELTELLENGGVTHRERWCDTSRTMVWLIVETICLAM